MTAHELQARDLTLGDTDADVVSHLDLQVPDGRITAIVGANAREVDPAARAGQAPGPARRRSRARRHPMRELRSIDVAKVLGFLPQSPVAPDRITVGDLIGRGRYPHQGWFRGWSPADDEAVSAALEATGISDLVERALASLSGGQRQRVWVAMALAQDTDVLLLDEPTTFLDINHQVELLDLLTDLNRRSGKTIVLVLHGLNLACRYADHIVAMKDGAVLGQGAPSDIIDADFVAQLFGLACVVVPDPISGAPMIVVRGRHTGPTVRARPGQRRRTGIEPA